MVIRGGGSSLQTVQGSAAFMQNGHPSITAWFPWIEYQFYREGGGSKSPSLPGAGGAKAACRQSDLLHPSSTLGVTLRLLCHL